MTNYRDDFCESFGGGGDAELRGGGGRKRSLFWELNGIRVDFIFGFWVVLRILLNRGSVSSCFTLVWPVG